MVMSTILAAQMIELTRHLCLARSLDAKRSGHSKMHQQHIAGAKIRHQIFGAPAKAGHSLALEPRHKILLKGKSEVLAAGLSAQDPCALHDGLQSSAHGLDFGQFRHAGSSPPSRPTTSSRSFTLSE